MSRLHDLVDRVAIDTGFSGVVRVDSGDDIELVRAYGLADRRHGIAMTVDTQLSVASGSKALTALAVMSLVRDGALRLSTTARSVLGGDLPLIADDVTVEHLLAHRSGIGDFLDDDADVSEYALGVPVHALVSTEQYLPILGGRPTMFAAGTRFCYCNGGYVVLALIAERSAGVPFHDLVRQRVCAPAGLADTDFLRSDNLPGRAASGYLLMDGEWRANIFHLPVLGAGDGGIYTTVADVHRFWTALFAGRIVPAAIVSVMTRPRSRWSGESAEVRYGLGFWLRESGDAVFLEGYDAGVSFRSVHDPTSRLTHTVIGNTTEGAWPITQVLATHLEAHLPVSR